MRSLKSELLRHGFRPSGRSVDKKNARTRVRQSEWLTGRDWAEIMGTNRPIYGKVKGLVKQR